MAKRGEGTSFVGTIIGCFCYLIVIMVVGIFGKETLDSPIWYLVGLAVVSFLAALWFSKNTKYFQKDAVDFFYYTTGILGVVVIFSSQGLERVEVSERIEVQSLEQKRDRAAENLDTFERSLPRLSTIFEAISSNPDSFLDEVRRIRSQYKVPMTFIESASCYRALTGHDVLGLDRLTRNSDRRNLDRHGDRALASPRRNAEQFAAEAACDAANKRVEVERERIAALPITFEEIATNQTFTAELGSNELRVGDTQVMLSTAAEALSLIGDPSRLEQRRKGLTDKKTSAKSAYEERRGNLDKLIADYKEREGTFPNLLRYHYWPYVLILLLSLKLSRPRT